jgi:hypothetical protein
MAGGQQQQHILSQARNGPLESFFKSLWIDPIQPSLFLQQ